MRRISRQFLALALSGVTATGFAVANIAQSTFRDIPAGHWAQVAVEYVSKRGLINGYQDGTFRGGRNLTRYEAAAIFYRLLQSGTINTVDAEGRNLINKGISDVRGEYSALATRVNALETTNGSQDSRISALEGQIRNLSVAPSGGNTQVNADQVLNSRLTTVEQRLNQLGEFEARLKQLEGRVDRVSTVENRLQTLEGRVNEGNQQLNARFQAVDGLTGRVTGLETQSRNLDAKIEGVSSRDNQRIEALDAQARTISTKLDDANARQDRRLSDLEERVSGLGRDADATPGGKFVRPEPEYTGARVYVGVGTEGPILPWQGVDLNNIQFSGMVGLSNLIDLGHKGLGIRFEVDYNRTSGAFTFNPALMLESDGVFAPYSGLGVGFGGTTPTFVNAIWGFDVNVFSWAALYLEFSPRYTFSTQQFGADGRFGFKIKF
jgi:archaellum component FlaC